MLLRFKHYRLLEQMNERQKRMHYDLHLVLDALEVMRKVTGLSPEDQKRMNEIYNRVTASRRQIENALPPKQKT